MVCINHKYEVKKIQQLCPSSKGITAGMWAIVQTIEEAIAFTDTEQQALDICRVLEGTTTINTYGETGEISKAD